jgi:hypothetical protein
MMAQIVFYWMQAREKMFFSYVKKPSTTQSNTADAIHLPFRLKKEEGKVC